ncbi:Protein kinase domain-containing protein [Mycena indigotica]|uniref:Protein kinase domain-containing protein n=1 Tax=Mycena indigotica TaxID=2126181 RepID=A0A8H6SHE4_9AGAR|nr:Protein kinase domain-containing protein [Mycena indigotica]KAF7298736.1 Protein kinase domain-containing protein [Mycena indigotica]
MNGGSSSSDPEAENLNARIHAPLGAWPGDMDRVDLDGERLSASEKAFVHTTKDNERVFKYFYNLTNQPMTHLATRELRMMLLAGEDISVKVEGRVFTFRGDLEGFVMPRESTLDLGSPKATKRRWIEQLQKLVSNMHDKGILHGDIKPANILVTGNGELVFCDWAAAQFKAEAKAPNEGTTAYQSPWRCRQYELPLCESDDLYALGISIWEIWVGLPPFDSEKLKDFEYSLDHEIADGLKPDLAAVDDEDVRGLIEMYLNSQP